MRRAWIAFVSLASAMAPGCGFNPEGGGPTDAAIDAPCVPRCSAAGDEAITCPGGSPQRTPCPYGCIDDSATPVCASTLVPSNVDPDLLQTFSLEEVQGGIPFERGARIAIDTDLGAIYKFPGNGPLVGVRPALMGISNGIGFERVNAGLSVLALLELRVVEGSTLEVYGTRALVIVTRLDAIIDGTVRADAGLCDSVSKRRGCNGAGGGRGGGELGADATGCAPGGSGVTGPTDTGGAGGGMATVGGDGGTSGTVAGGRAVTDLIQCGGETLVPLLGGGGGGRAFGGIGGGGGGGLQITSYGTLRVSATGVVTALGNGGQGSPIVANNGGGGGGAGGGILLEGATVDVGRGVISVAGGGGGGGRTPGRDGQAGRTDGMAALGGLGDGPSMSDGLGGNGAIDSIGALAGRGAAAGDLDGTGGGGGGLGRIRVNSVRGDTVRGPAFTGRFSAGRTTRRP